MRRRRRKRRLLLVEAAGSVFIVGVDEHLEGVVLDVGVAHHLLGDGVLVDQLHLHLEDRGSR